MANIRSSLHPQRLVRVPNVAHRPQESPACVVAFGGKVRERGGRMVDAPLKKTEVYQKTAVSGQMEYVSVREYTREYDNPDRPDTRVDSKGRLQWVGEFYTNLWQAMRYVAIANNPQNRERWAMDRALAAYRMSLRDAGICFLCKRPLKVKKAKLRFAESGSILRDVVYADVKSHFRVVRREDGRLEFRYFDGTGRRITVKRGRYQDEYYCDGERIYPKSTYRVVSEACDCKLGN